MKSLEIGSCLLLGSIFLISSVAKLRHPKGFVLTVLEYQVLPPRMGLFYGWALPPCELFLALLFLTGTAISVAACMAAILLLSFMGAISINLIRGRSLDCHCFGSEGRRKAGWPLVVQDGFLLSVAVALVLLTATPRILESWSFFSLMGPENVAGLAALLVSVGVTASTAFALRFFPSNRNAFKRAK
jgi:Methylamine utilisation protein MauE